MSHPSLQELTHAVHGLAPAPDHLELCADCRETTDRLRAERDLLRRADERLAVPLPRRRYGTLLPLALVAASLLVTAGLILFRSPAPPADLPATAPSQEPIKVDETIARFLDGDEKEAARARELLAAAGPSVLPDLVQARQDRSASLRPDALAALIFELKKKSAGAAGEPLFQTLKTTRATVKADKTKLSELAEFLGTLSSIPFYVDPRINDEAIDLATTETTLSHTLDLIAILFQVEYDVRYGVVFLSRSYRLFDVKNGPTQNGMKMYIPREGHWRRQVRSDEAADVLRKLDALQVDLSFNGTPQTDGLVFVRDLARVQMLMEAGIEIQNVSLQAKKMSAAHAIELLTLPHGLDVRFEGGTLLIYRRRE